METQNTTRTGVDWRSLPTWTFIAMNLLGIWTIVRISTGRLSPSTTAWIVMIGLWLFRSFFVATGYHRYFSHRSFSFLKWPRTQQFLFGLFASSSVQKGPLWWASHHREHHYHSDVPGLDPHTPKDGKNMWLARRFPSLSGICGLWWSHIGWVLAKGSPTKPLPDKVFDCAWLKWLDRNSWVPGVSLALACFLMGGVVASGSGFNLNSGWEMLEVGFNLSTVILWHTTFSINSLAHFPLPFSYRRYETADTSRNSPMLSLVTLGEGWHNNHHHRQGRMRQGEGRREPDIAARGIELMERMGLVKIHNK